MKFNGQIAIADPKTGEMYINEKFECLSELRAMIQAFEYEQEQREKEGATNE